MSLFTQYDQELTGVMFDELDDLIAGKLKVGAAGGATTKTPLANYSTEELRWLWRAARITEADWQAELVARGETAQSAADLIAIQKSYGVSTAAATKGQLTASESAKVEAIKASAIAALPAPPAPELGGLAGATPGRATWARRCPAAASQTTPTTRRERSTSQTQPPSRWSARGGSSTTPASDQRSST